MKANSKIFQDYPVFGEMIKHIPEQNGDQIVIFEDIVNRELEMIHASPYKLIWELKVKKKHCSSYTGLIHGGCVASIIDICSGAAILTVQGKMGWKHFGISTDLTVSYMCGISAGQTARIECQLRHLGKAIANIYTNIYDESGKLCYSGSHTKYYVEPKL